MTVKTWTKKIAGVSVAGALLAGVGTTAALAVTPKATAAPTGAYTMSEITNLTPYPWTFTTVPGAYSPMFSVAPPATLAPGQTASWAVRSFDGDSKSYFDYVFTDFTGFPHTVFVTDWAPNGPGPSQQIWVESMDGAPSYAQQSTANFRINADPDGFNRHVDAVWTQPYATTVDAATDPSLAAAIVNEQLPRVAADAVSWTPTSKTPTYHQVDKEQISSTVQNYSSAKAVLDVEHATSVGQSTTIGAETTASISTKVFGFAAKVAASVTSDKEWGASDSVNISQSADIDPGYAGYVYRDNSIATLTGTLRFTTPEGAGYTITNVAISSGNIIDPNGTMPSGMDVSATEAPLGAGN